MYLTAHRVVSPQGLQDINAFLHLHNRPWTGEAPRPEADPGETIDEIVPVKPPAGNRVRSFLDVVAPDHYPLPDLHAALQRLIERAQAGRFPVEIDEAPVYLRFSLERGMADRWAEEMNELARVALHLLHRQEEMRVE